MKKKVLFVLAVLVLILTTAGSINPHGWQDNTAVAEDNPVFGGKFLVVRDGAGIEFNNVGTDQPCIEHWITGTEDWCTDDLYLTQDDQSGCTKNYPEHLGCWGGAGIDMSVYLGWNDPDWWDGFNFCIPDDVPNPCD